MKRAHILFGLILFQFFHLGFAICQSPTDTLVQVEDGYEKIFTVGDTIAHKEYFTTMSDLEKQHYIGNLEFTWIKIIPYDKIGTMSIYKLDKDKLIWEKNFLGTKTVICFEGKSYDPALDIVNNEKVCYYKHLPHGLWRYWDNSGKLKKVEVYDNGALILSKEINVK